MVGAHFPLENFKKLLDLNIGISDRLDAGCTESFTVLYCDLKNVGKEVIDSSLEEVLRTSDSVINKEEDYFFVLPSTDKYGAGVVKKMFDSFYQNDLRSGMVSYPIDGETSQQLLHTLQETAHADILKVI